MTAITNELTNRDIALLVWLTAFTIYILALRDVRKSLKPLLRMVFFSKITVFLIAMMTYVSLIILGGYKLGAWQPWMLKDTFYWFFGSALATFFGVDQAGKDEHYFKRTVLNNLRFAVVLDFVINFYVFNLVFELLLLPFVVVLAMLLVVAGSKPEFAQVKTVLQWLSAFVGVAILAHAAVELVTNPGSVATIKNLQDLVLPLVLTVLYLPFVYVVALYMAYELLYVRLKVLDLNIHRNVQLTQFTMRQVVKVCRLRLSRLRRFSGDFAVNVCHAESRAEVMAIINEYKTSVHARSP